MSVVLAAIDYGWTDRLVLDASLAAADLLDASARAVHVIEPGEDLAKVRAIATEAGVDLLTEAGPVEVGIQRAAAARDVIALVISTSSGRRGRPPVADTAVSLLTTLKKTLIVVPAGAVVRPRLQRVLIPHEEAQPLPAAARRLLTQVCGGDRDVTILHVQADAGVPMFSDQPQHEAPAWGQEFLRRAVPGLHEAVHLDTRAGDPVDEVVALARTVDVVALTWHRDLSAGRALVVRSLLEHGSCPIILIPLDARRGGGQGSGRGRQSQRARLPAL